MSSVAESSDRRFEIALGVDQEVGGDHDAFAFFHPVDNFNIAIAARTELDFAWFEAAFALLDALDNARPVAPSVSAAQAAAARLAAARSVPVDG